MSPVEKLYLKALGAKDSGVLHCLALPSSSFDRTIRNGLAEIPICRPNEQSTIDLLPEHAA